MFEKEAEEIAKDIYIHHFDDDVNYPEVLKAITVGVQDGAEFGYNKANEWHFVKDGVLPKDKEYVLIYTDLNNCYVATKVENHFMSKGWGFIPMSTVIAWKEIVPPKESE